jgi:hypothetical protein
LAACDAVPEYEFEDEIEGDYAITGSHTTKALQSTS